MGGSLDIMTGSKSNFLYKKKNILEILLFILDVHIGIIYLYM